MNEYFQVQMILPGESWKIDQLGSPDQYLIHPISLEVGLDRCLITDDPRLPKIKIHAKLPSICLKMAG